jgi:hypothetical protein
MYSEKVQLEILNKIVQGHYAEIDLQNPYQRESFAWLIEKEFIRPADETKDCNEPQFPNRVLPVKLTMDGEKRRWELQKSAWQESKQIRMSQLTETTCNDTAAVHGMTHTLLKIGVANVVLVLVGLVIAGVTLFQQYQHVVPVLTPMPSTPPPVQTVESTTEQTDSTQMPCSCEVRQKHVAVRLLVVYSTD